MREREREIERERERETERGRERETERGRERESLARDWTGLGLVDEADSLIWDEPRKRTGATVM